MTVPGSNLLAQALTLITPQAVSYKRYLGETTSAAGIKTASYANPVTLYGSFQPADRAAMAVMGLDMNKRYAVFYARQSFREPGRDGAGDHFAFNGRLWQDMGGADWFPVDGWASALLVDVGAHV